MLGVLVSETLTLEVEIVGWGFGIRAGYPVTPAEDWNPNTAAISRGLMTKSSGAENIDDQGLHQHFCYVVGHDFECSEDCVCICGHPMNGNDHTDCPVELRPCPKHESEQMQAISEEALPEGVVEIKFPADRQRAAVNCECGCSEIDLAEVVGWCLHCNHVYAAYNPEIENHHFA